MTENNEVPKKYSWINRAFFENILQKKLADNKTITVLNYSVKDALGKGENYASHMLRATITYSIEPCDSLITDQLIIKVGLCDEGMQNLMDEFFVFHREFIVYRDIMSNAEALLQSIGDNTQLGARTYDISKTPGYFVFEDLSLRGFKMPDRKVGLDRQHLKMTLAKLAKWHATTAVLHEKDPTIMEHHNFSNFNDEQRSFYPLFENSLIACADQAKNWPGFEKISEKMYKLKPNLMKKGCQVYTRDDNCFNVLTHGDLWVNNTMFQYNAQNEPVDVMLVDYAVGYFGSPAIDLCYLFATSCVEQLKERDFDQLLQYYHEELVASLQKLDYKKRFPTLTDLQIEILKKGMVGVIYSMFLVALLLVEDTANADLSNLLFDTEHALQFRKIMFQHPRYRRRMEYLLDLYDRKGYLE